ncbi:uncharacterized protein LOC119745165 [Patiria miniata]|uniref:HMG domain-containing protein n=1 Tax=Patiria miniata TaxID=46514 RepID=A0A914BM09_PATMI|nr:uncharacterized protein LOC119745165 [Patiria miniata]
MAEPSEKDVNNALNRERYREKWHDYNLRSRYLDELSTPGDVSKLPRLKRSRSDRYTKGTSGTSSNTGSSTTASRPRPTNAATHEGGTHQGDGNDVPLHGGSEENRCQYGHGEVEVLEAPEIYRQLLLETNSISPCDEHFTKFLLNGYNSENHSIEGSRYVMVTRRAMCFSGTWKWAFYCSCDPARSQVLHSASEHVQQRSQDLPGCLHIDCLAGILVRFDENVGITAHHQSQDHSYAHASGLEEDVQIPPNLNDVWPVCGNPRAAVIVTDQSFAVIDIVGNGLKCLTCRRGDCQHISKIKDILEQVTDLPVFLLEMSALLESTSLKRKAGAGSVASWKRIPFQLESIHLQDMVAKPVMQRGCTVNGNLHLIPTPGGMCACCHASWSNDIYLKGEYPVFTLQSIHRASVFFRKCSNEMCDSELQYDGLSDCLFNMTTYLIDHSVLRQYMYQFLYGRSPMFGFYSVWVQMQNDAGHSSFASQLHYNKFVWAWYGFLRLLDIDYHEQFICREQTCGAQPDIIICDATHLSLRKDLSLWKDNVPKATKEAKQSSSSVYRKSIFLVDTQTRKLLKKFARSSEAHPFPPNDFLMLIDGCKEHQGSLLPFLNELGSTGHATAPPATYKPLLQALSATSPVCGLLHPEAELLELLEKMAHGFSPRKDLNAMAILTNKCPIIADLIASEQVLPEVLFPVLCELLRLAVAPFEQSTSSQSPAAVQAERSTDHPPPDDFDGMCFWPHFPQQRLRPKYAMDGLKTTRTSCRKDSKNYGRMTPGVFAAFCPHGICYGFEIMNQFESPNVPFTLLLTRFETPPKMIVYDNACHLHAYCLNREPGMFKKTKFLIDRLHWPNHTACSVGYKLDGYSKYKAINSQVAEQMNSSLQRIKVQLSYMAQDNFLWHCRFFLWGKNMKKQSVH